MILNTLFPVFAVIALGYLLKRTGFVPAVFFPASDRLVYYIFFPCMLFWKIGTGGPLTRIDPGLLASGLCAVLLIFAASTLFIVIANVPAFKAGSFSQSCYRFNTYIGMAIILNAAGDEGVVIFAVLIGVLIPVINLLSVAILIWFSDTAAPAKQKQRYLIRALAYNPLILACIAGVVFAVSGLGLPKFIDSTLSLVSMITLPLALISIGSGFSFKKFGGHLKLVTTASVFKLVLLPAIGAGFMHLFNVDGISFQTGMIYFCLPTSTAIYILSSQLHSDTELASAAIVISTLFSFVSLSVVLSWI